MGTKSKELGAQFRLNSRAAAILAEVEARAEKLGIVELEALMNEARQPGYTGHAGATLNLLGEILDVRCGRVEPSPEAQAQAAAETDAKSVAWRAKEAAKRAVRMKLAQTGLSGEQRFAIQAELNAIDAPPPPPPFPMPKAE